MQLKPWIVAVNFGDGPTAQLYVNAIVAPTSELAVAHVVAMTLLQIKTDQPLTRIMWQEVEAEFLTAALSLMRGEAGGEKVVSLRVVEEPKAEVPQPYDPLPEQPLGGQLGSDFGSPPKLKHHWVSYTNHPLVGERPGFACSRCGDWREETEPGDGECHPRLM